jgi:serine/threonine protein kinase
VLDFGISKVLTAGAEVDVTKTRQLLGSPLYMSPEQMQSTRSADTRSDIWSLGIILYKLVTGNVPFAAQSIVQLVEMVLSASPTPPSKLNPALPSGFDAVILRCLRRNRDERYANVVELAVDLERFAPPEAAAYVKTMGRVFAATGLKPRMTSSSAGIEDSNRQGAPQGQIRPPGATKSAPELAPPLSPSPAVLAPVSMFTPPSGVAKPNLEASSSDESTTVSWGQAKARVMGRSHLPVIWVVVVGIVLLAIVGLVLALTSPANRLGSSEAPTPSQSRYCMEKGG